MSPSELLAQSRERIWPHLKSLGMLRDQVVDGLPVDFYHPELRVSIAIGGRVEQSLDYAIERQGIRRWHFSAGWARENPGTLVAYIRGHLTALRFSEENCARMDRANQEFGDSGRVS